MKPLTTDQARAFLLSRGYKLSGQHGYVVPGDPNYVRCDVYVLPDHVPPGVRLNVMVPRRASRFSTPHLWAEAVAQYEGSSPGEVWELFQRTP